MRWDTAVVPGRTEIAAAAASTGLQSPAWFPDWVPEGTAGVLASIVVLALAWLVSRLVVRLVGRRVARQLQRPSLTRTALRGIRVGIFVLALLVVLRLNGLDLGNIALSVTVFSAVVGVILAPIVGSVISGLFLLADQPYEIGDMIELTDESKRGFVEDITLRYTKIFTLDNTFLVVPNGNIRDRDVYNYSAEDTRTRQTLDVMVTYESDIEEARDLIERSARNVDAVIEGGPRIRIGASRYPAYPDCLIADFADHGVLLRLRYWVKEPYKIQTVRSVIQTNIWDELAEADVEIAYPHSHLYFDDTSGELQVSMREQGSGQGPDLPADAPTDAGGENQDEGERDVSEEDDALSGNSRDRPGGGPPS
ncbi:MULTISPECIES: mechanosensitive ion channel family protein [Salinibaculum]|uniref:mechanosensitive ion channel family protein n=1 Tax=Salinibaculum TaxID=2732368 RepID=UPI0030CDC2AE